MCENSIYWFFCDVGHLHNVWLQITIQKRENFFSSSQVCLNTQNMILLTLRVIETHTYLTFKMTLNVNQKLKIWNWYPIVKYKFTQLFLRPINFIETVTPTTVIESQRVILNVSGSNILLRFVSEKEKHLEHNSNMKDNMKNIYFQILIWNQQKIHFCKIWAKNFLPPPPYSHIQKHSEEYFYRKRNFQTFLNLF